MFIALTLAAHTLVGPMVASALTDDGSRVLAPICIEGKIKYVLIDLSGDGAIEIPGEAPDGHGDTPEIAFEIDCPASASKSALLTPSTALPVDGPGCPEPEAPQVDPVEIRPCLQARPPARGPPSLP